MWRTRGIPYRPIRCVVFRKRRAEKRSAFRRFERSGILLVCRVIAAIGFRGGTFFTVNLRDPRSDLFVTQIDMLRDAVRRVHALPHRRLGCPPRSYALPMDLATRRCRLPRSVARNQNRICEVFAYRRLTIAGDDQPRRSGLCGSHGPHAFQPGETWSRGAPGGLAAFVVSSWMADVSRRVARRQ
jgi:hypothetical protein